MLIAREWVSFSSRKSSEWSTIDIGKRMNESCGRRNIARVKEAQWAKYWGWALTGAVDGSKEAVSAKRFPPV